MRAGDEGRTPSRGFGRPPENYVEHIQVRQPFLCLVEARTLGLPDEVHAQSANSGIKSSNLVDTLEESALTSDVPPKNLQGR